MKKRVVSLLLCLVMALSVFLTGCAEKTTFEAVQIGLDGASADNRTLSMWVVCEEDIDEKTQREVSAALSAITETALKVRLAVTFYTEDEYEAKLSATIEAFDPLNKVPAVKQPIGNEPLKEGELRITYPQLMENQVDIIYIANEQMYNDYVAKGWLRSLDDQINASMNKPLKEYVSSALFNSFKLDGKNTYAIPNNNPIGEYKYMLLDKDLFDEYYGNFGTDIITGFYDEDLYVYLEQVAKERNDVALIDGSYEECLDLLAHYWSFDETSYKLLKDFAVFGHAYTDADNLNRGSIELGYANLFANKSFRDNFLKLNEYASKGYFEEGTAKKSVVKFVECEYSEIEDYQYDYYMVPVAAPTVTNETLFANGMFGVCSKSDYFARSMQVITYINTKADFRNTLLYGILGTHYNTETRKVDGKEYTVAVRYNNDYMMSLEKTGNVFLAYPLYDEATPDKNLAPNVWDYVKVQNYEAKIDPTLGFALANQAYVENAMTNKVNEKLDVELTNYMNALNAELVAMINATKTGSDWYDDLVVLVDEIAILLDAESKATVDEFTALKSYLEATDNTVAGDLETLRANLKNATSANKLTGNLYSPYGVYKQWLTASGLNVRK